MRGVGDSWREVVGKERDGRRKDRRGEARDRGRGAAHEDELD